MSVIPILVARPPVFPEAVCLRYRSQDASQSDWGCAASVGNDDIPRWIGHVLGAIGPGHISLQREISVYGLPVGTLRVESDDANLLQGQWRSVRELLGLTAVTVLVLDALAFWVIGQSLRPTARSSRPSKPWVKERTMSRCRRCVPVNSP